MIAVMMIAMVINNMIYITIILGKNKICMDAGQ
jgi:hypothetical protein